MKMIFKLVMRMKNNYNTKQKDLIINVIKSIKHEFTIKEIYNLLNKKVGLTTIYRKIDELVSNGIVSKQIAVDNITYYEYLEHCDNENHFFLKCSKCGNLSHIDCECIESLSNHILKKHKFNLNRENVIMNGICNKCMKGNRK